MSRHDPAPPMPDWQPQSRPWCGNCCVRADQCGCPEGERLTLAAMDAYEAHLIRGTE